MKIALVSAAGTLLFAASSIPAPTSSVTASAPRKNDSAHSIGRWRIRRRAQAEAEAYAATRGRSQ
jgi:hypothetical protein